MILKENMPSHRYLRCEEANDFIGKEVYGRNPVDWGDNLYWEKGILCNFEPTNYKTTSRDTKGKWEVRVKGCYNRIFDWCSVEIPNEPDGTIIQPDMWPGFKTEPEPKLTMNIDEAIAALSKARQALGTEATLIFVSPNHGIAANVVDLVANKEDNSVRVVIR